jgi:hypothetical protein
VKNEQDEYCANNYSLRLAFDKFEINYFCGILQGKSVEAEMDALKDEYHQRVATLERKVRHIIRITQCFYHRLIIT